MSRSVAFVAFLALWWSNVAGLRCDMGAEPIAVAAAHDVATSHAHSPGHAHYTHSGHGNTAADAPAPHPSAPSHAHDLAHAAETPPSPHPTNHGTPHGCLMIMACSIASPRPAHPAAMIRIPTVLVRAAFPTPPTPVAADLAVETPPPRHTV